MKWNTLIISAISYLVLQTASKLQFEAHRLLQYQVKEHVPLELTNWDKDSNLDGIEQEGELRSSQKSDIPGMKYTIKQFGSQSLALSSTEAAHYLAPQLNAKGKVIVLHLNEFADVEITWKRILLKQPKGVLFIIPGVSHDNTNDVNAERWNTICEELTSQEIAIPVYFSFENEAVTQFYDELKSQKKDGEGEKIVVAAKQTGKSKTLESLELDVFYAVQEFGRGEKSQNPVIVISAAYDSLGVAPSVSAGVENSVSPVLALLHLSRAFGNQSFVKQMGTNFDLIFVLTPSASLEYKATSDFVGYQKLPWARVQLVVCLDALVDSSKSWDNGQSLYVYQNQKAKQSQVSEHFISNLKRASADKRFDSVKDLGVFSTVYPAHITSQFVPFEHIVYGDKSVPALTITAKKQVYKSVVEKFSLVDQDLCVCKLSTALEVVAEALARTLVADEFQYRLAGTMAVTKEEKAYMRHARDFLKANSRAPQFIERDSPVSLELFRLLTLNQPNSQRVVTNLKEVQLIKEDASTMPKGKGAGGALLTASIATSPVFEFAIFCAVLVYLGVLYQVINFFSSSVSIEESVSQAKAPSKKSKTKRE